MAWAVVIRAEDGRHVKSYSTQSLASQAMRDQVGRREGLSGAIPANTNVIDDFGRSVTITQMPKGVTGKKYAAYLDAYDARETGTLTPEQEALLANWAS
jgi:hypothetical protein